VLTNDEVHRIADLAAPHNVPVFVDSAYAPPYPALNFTEMTPIFRDNMVHCLSLSKAGLPGERIGIALGDESIIQILQSFQTNLCIHSSRYGQAIAARAIASGALAHLSETVIRPYYRNKFAVLADSLDQYMPADVPWYLHRGEGAIFAWLWFDQLPVTDRELYQQLKQYGVIVVPGDPFFPGLRDDWSHTRQCIRISLTAADREIDQAIQHLATVVTALYQPSRATAGSGLLNTAMNEALSDDWIEIGRIVAPQGLNGEMRVYPDSDFPERFLEPGDRWLLKPGHTEPEIAKLVSGRVLAGKGLYVIKLQGVNHRDQVEALREARLLIAVGDRLALAPGEFHVADLVGLTVRLQSTGEALAR
jgi:16S rRNA processing protein RimM